MKRELQNRMKILEQQLFIFVKYKKSLDKKFGEKGTQKLINNALDELILIKKELDKLNEKKN